MVIDFLKFFNLKIPASKCIDIYSDRKTFILIQGTLFSKLHGQNWKQRDIYG